MFFMSLQLLILESVEIRKEVGSEIDKLWRKPKWRPLKLEKKQ